MPAIAKTSEAIISERIWASEPTGFFWTLVGTEASCGVNKIWVSPSNSTVGVSLDMVSFRK